MKKSLIIHLLVMVLAAFVGTKLAMALHGLQNDTVKSKGMLSTLPMGGFHKFASDIEWMRFINYLGGLKTINDENKDEVIRRLEKILSYDPNFSKAYHMGALSISNASPEKAVELLRKACENEQLKDNWRIPFLAGFIQMHYYGKPNFEEAQDFFRKAIERSGGKPEDYVVNSYLRAKARAKGITNNKLAMLDTLFIEWKRSNGEGLEVSVIPNLPERLIAAARDAKASCPNDQEVLKLLNEVSTKLLADKHLCPKCLANLAAGDKFCSSCGTKVQVYGTCSKCQSVLKGKYCSTCGFDNGK